MQGGSIKEPCTSLDIARIEPDFKDRIRTVLDVVEYFARYGLHARVRLFHCVRREGRGTDYGDLVVVPRAEALSRAQYVTFTASGVVQFYSCGSPCEFTPLCGWLRDLSWHRELATTDVARCYWGRMLLRTWGRRARHARLRRIRADLDTRITWLRPHYSGATQAVLEQVQEVSQLQLLDLSAQEGAWGLTQLLESQEAVRSSSLASAARCVASICAVCGRLAEIVRRNKGDLHADVAAHQRDPSNGASAGRSPVRVQAEAAAKKAEYDTARQDAALLMRFVRLADALLLGALTCLCRDAVAALAAAVRHGGLLSVEARLSDDNTTLTFFPPKEDVLRGMSRGLMDGILSCARAVPRVSLAAGVADGQPQGRRLMGSISAVTGNAAQLGPAAAAGQQGGGEKLLEPSALYNDQLVAQLRLQIEQAVMRSFSAAAVRCCRARALLPINAAMQRWRPEHHRTSALTVCQLRKDLQAVRQWQAQVAAVSDSSHHGLLEVRCTALKAALTGHLRAAHGIMLLRLVLTAHALCRTATAQLQKEARAMSQRPSGLDEFVSLCEEYDMLRGECGRTTLRSAAVVSALTGLVTGSGGQVPHSHQVDYEDMSDALATRQRAMEAAAAYIDSRRPGVVLQLTRAAADLDRQAATLEQSLADLLPAGPQHGSPEVAEDRAERLLAMTATGTALTQQAARLRHFQLVMGLGVAAAACSRAEAAAQLVEAEVRQLPVHTE